MLKRMKKAVAALLVVLMLVTSAPLQSFAGIELPDLFSTKAEAATVSGYSNYVAAQWAIDHLNDSWSILEGKGYYDDGGDCANFVSQCIYMGGMDMENLWNYAGYLAHYGTVSDGSWIRAHQLYNYVVSKGGISIVNPTASQVSVGDLIFWKTTDDGRIHHSAIVIGIDNGVPEIAYHSTRDSSGREINKRTKDWTLGYASWRTYLVKMNGATCVAQNPRDFDVYIANSSSPFRSDASTSASLLKTVQGGDYFHVYQTRNNQGYTWGYGHYKGAWGWTNLGNFHWSSHVKSHDVSHVFGDWFVAVRPTCVLEGVSKRVCTRCGYEETKSISVVGHKPGAEPTCVSPQLCTVCGALIKDALGHDLTEEFLAADCYNDARIEGGCKRCDLPPYYFDAKTDSWSDWSPVPHDVSDKDAERKRTAYRWRQRDTKTSYNQSEAGYVQTGGQWVQSGSGSFDFVYEFTGGSAGNNPDWNNSYIRQYNVRPYSSSETQTNKRSVSISATNKYLYWHWCENIHNGNYNHEVESACKGNYTTFHAEPKDYNATYFKANCYQYTMPGYGCSYWWYKNQIHNCSYTDYRRLFSYEKYSDWSEWNVSSEMPETIQQMIKSGQTTKTVGSTTYYVENRSEYQYSLDKALGHAWHEDESYLADESTGAKIWKVTKPATETEEGEAVRICDRDSSHMDKIAIAKTACTHDWSTWTEIPCPEGGEETRTCSKCGSTETRIVEPGHVWGKWIVDKEAVPHSEDGLKHRICERNSEHIEEVVIDAHDLEFVEHVAATCTEAGYDLYRCTVCDNFEVKKNEYGPLGHNMPEEWTLSKAAVCNKDGSVTDGEEVKICLRCGYTITRPVTTTHDIQKVLVNTEVINPGDERIDSVCEIEHYAYVCSKCAYEEKTEDVEIPHNWETDSNGDPVWTTIEEASHGHNGMQKNVCLNHEEHIRNKEIPMPDDHNYVENQVVVPCSYDSATKTEKKGYTYTEHVCSICGDKITSDVEIVDHQFSEWTTVKEATCTELGENVRTCAVCGYPESEFIDSIGHSTSPSSDGYADSEDKMELVSSVKNACGNGTVDTYQCVHIDKNTGKRCTYTEVIGEEKDHKLGDYIVTLEPTCTEVGYQHKECVNGDYRTEDEPIPPTGHDYKLTGKGTATCTEPAYETYTCAKCGDTYNKHIDQPLGHLYNKYVDDGNPDTHKIVCERDNSHVLCREAHTFDDGKVTKSATCEQNGQKTYTCSLCGAKKYEIIPALGHDWDNGVIDPDSNCTDEGVITYICKRDSSHKRTESVSPKGHVAGEPKQENLTAAQCETDGGYDTVTRCTVCNVILESVHTKLDKLGHNYSEWVDSKDGANHIKTCQRDTCTDETPNHTVTEAHNMEQSGRVEPTCTKEGYIEYTCSICKYTYKTPLEIKPHTSLKSVEENRIEPTCTESGSYDTVKYCADCGKELERVSNTIDPLEHDWDEGVINPDSNCTDEGVITYTCKRDPSHTRTEAISPKGHTPGEPERENYVAPECEKDGGYDTVIRCKICNVIISSDHVVLKATGHDWSGEWEITKEPTIYAEGEAVLHCKKDSSHIKTKMLDRLVSYTATFVVDGKTVEEVKFTPGTKYINEPDLKPYDKDNYTVDWEEYELKDEDIVINAVYTLIDPKDVSKIETEKTVDKFENGNALITLSASAASRTISFNSTSSKSKDIILVLDQSGSMRDELGSGETKVDALKKCANDFLFELNKNALETGANHRVALVGFGSGAGGHHGGSYSKLNYEGTGILATNTSGAVSYKTIETGKWNNWSDALISIGDESGVNSKLTSAISRIEPNGATRTDLGLDIAFSILRDIDNDNDSGRERIVVLITDGDPTDYNSNEQAIEAVVPNAVSFAKEIKSKAKLYTIGIKDDADPDAEFDSTENGITVGTNTTFDFNRFLNIVSSNYPNAAAMNRYEDKLNNGYYMAVTNTDNLNAIFSKILITSVYKTLTFKKATLVDTLSKDFTLTIEQENAMRNNLKNTLNIDDRDISVSRNEDGTTTIRIANVPVVKNEKGGKAEYVAGVKFECSYNGTKAGEYDTNTDDAFVEIDSEKVAQFTKPEKVNVTADRNIVVFKINGNVYRIWEGNLGDKIVVPETELAKWTVDETITGSYAEYEADEIDIHKYTVTWVVDGNTTEETYTFGQTITPPEVPAKEGLEFKYWSPAVPQKMPARNVTYTAVYGAPHVHSYKQSFYGSCDDGLVLVKTCACGNVVEEKQLASEHKFKAYVTNYNENTVYETVICDVCKKTEKHSLKFKLAKSKSGRTTAINFTLLKNNVIIQPNENGIEIRIPLRSIGLSSSSKVEVTRVNESGTMKKYNSRIEDDYLIFTADHFSIYVISQLDENGNPIEKLNYAQITCLLNGHSYEDSVTAPTCTEKGYTTHTCTNCGDDYRDSETAALGHNFIEQTIAPTCEESGCIKKVCSVCSVKEFVKNIPATGHSDNNNDGKCDNCGEVMPSVGECDHLCHSKNKIIKIIWKIVRIFYKLLRINRICSCGKAHY